MRIKFKKTAVEDMRATKRYIREQLNNPSAAAKLTRRVYDAIMLLEDNPFMGTELCSRYAVDTDIRFLVVAKQIVFYRVVGNEYVEVTRVLDGRQDYMYTQNAQRKELCAFFYALAPSVRRRAARKPTARNGALGAASAAPERRNPLSLTGGYKSDKIGELRKTLYKINRKRR